MTAAADIRPTRRDAVRNRHRLIEAAAAVFAASGLEAGVEEVAKAAGVGMGTLYRHFPTKELLISALVDDIVRAMVDAAEAAVGKEGGTGLEWFLEEVSALQAANRGCLPRLWRVDSEQQPMQRLRQLIARMLHDAKASGRVRPELRETDITMVLWSIRGVIETTGSVAPDAWRRHLTLLLAALRPGDPPLVHPPLTRAQVRRIVSGA